jgi:alanyl aminopeptidase
VVANADALGYYRNFYKGDLLDRLLRDGGRKLSLAEKLGGLRDVAALSDAGHIPAGEALALLTPFAADPNRHIVSAAAQVAAKIQDNFVTDELRAHYTRYVQVTFGPRARELGWIRKPAEDEEIQLLRPSLVGLVARYGEDRALQAEAKQLSARWLEDRNTMPADLVASVLSVAAESGDRELFERFRAEAKKAERRDRGRIFEALGSFREPTIAREALGVLLSNDFDMRESIGILWIQLRDARSRHAAWEFFKQNYDALLSRLPREYGGFLPFAGSFFCDVAHRADVESFFKDRVEKLVGAKRALAQTLEGISQCEALKAAQAEGVAAFLRKY